MAIPLLDDFAIDCKGVIADAMLTRHRLASYLVEDRHAHEHFIESQPTPSAQDLVCYFQRR